MTISDNRPSRATTTMSRLYRFSEAMFEILNIFKSKLEATILY